MINKHLEELQNIIGNYYTENYCNIEVDSTSECVISFKNNTIINHLFLSDLLEWCNSNSRHFHIVAEVELKIVVF